MTALSNIIRVFNQIKGFTIEQGNPQQTRNGLVNEVHISADSFYTAAAPWIPFLAYQKGDVTKNIAALTDAVQEGQSIVDSAKKTIQSRGDEIEQIIEKAREASASAGAAVFTKDFRIEAGDLKGKAEKWLTATIIMAGISIAAAAVMWYWVNDVTNEWQLVQKLGTKFVILGVLISGTFWCGRIYKALMHQSSVYNHRALSVQTLQAFSAGAADTQTKDAVLIEAARAVFGNVPTGYLDPRVSGSEADLKVIEIAKNFTQHK